MNKKISRKIQNRDKKETANNPLSQSTQNESLSDNRQEAYRLFCEQPFRLTKRQFKLLLKK